MKLKYYLKKNLRLNDLFIGDTRTIGTFENF